MFSPERFLRLKFWAYSIWQWGMHITWLSTCYQNVALDPCRDLWSTLLTWSLKITWGLKTWTTWINHCDRVIPVIINNKYTKHLFWIQVINVFVSFFYWKYNFFFLVEEVLKTLLTILVFKQVLMTCFQFSFSLLPALLGMFLPSMYCVFGRWAWNWCRLLNNLILNVPCCKRLDDLMALSFIYVSVTLFKLI